MKKSKFTGEQIAYALRQAELGVTVAEVCRKMGISPADEAPDLSFWADTNPGQGHHLSSHKRAAVKERIEAAGATLRFLPPYNPDFNPIEKAFSRLKAILRKAGERTVSGLWGLIGRLVDIFQPAECANYFSSCGYEPE